MYIYPSVCLYTVYRDLHHYHLSDIALPAIPQLTSRRQTTSLSPSITPTIESQICTYPRSRVRFIPPLPPPPRAFPFHKDETGEKNTRPGNARLSFLLSFSLCRTKSFSPPRAPPLYHNAARASTTKTKKTTRKFRVRDGKKKRENGNQSGYSCETSATTLIYVLGNPVTRVYKRERGGPPDRDRK